MKRVLIIHGFGGKPNGGWRPWLTAELAKSRIWAFSLAMPAPDEPKREEWVEELVRYVDRYRDDELYLVGHSLGVAAVIRFLERPDTPKINGAVLIAGPSGPTGNEHTRDFYETPFDYGSVRAKIGKCAIIHGNDDKLVPMEHADRLSEGLGAPLTIVKGAGHFNSSSGCFKLPEALEALLEIME